MIPFWPDEISADLAGVDFTLQFHGEINFHPSKAGQVSPSSCLQKSVDFYWFKNAHKMMNFYKDIFFYIFFIDWRHMCRKNTIQIIKIFQTDVLINIFIPVRWAEAVT